MISPKVAIDFILTPDPRLYEFYLSYIRDNSKGLTILQFWFKLWIMRFLNWMTRRRILFTTGLVFLAAWPLFSAVKQVRVIAERASIYIEPNRTSSRIEIVGKGTILNLLQDRKVKDIWYYISFNSPRYGTRISGFIQESAVEPVVESPPALPREEEKVVPPPKAEEKKEVPAEIPPQKVASEVKPAPETPPAISEVSVLTRLPKNKSYKFPRQEVSLQDAAWKIVEIAPVVEEKPPVEIREFAALTVPPKRKAITLPKKEMPRDDPAWQVIQPVIAENAEPKERVELKPPQITPSRKGPGFITLGLGYGSSFGGAGGCLQLNTRIGLSFHAGVGLYPTSLIYSETDWVKNETLWSVGLKYYLPFKSAAFSPFVDIQYGGQRVEAAQVVIGIWDYEYVLSQEQKSVWGPSFLAGIEFRKGRFGISAALGVSYATTSWQYLQTKVAFVFDTGLVFHF